MSSGSEPRMVFVGAVEEGRRCLDALVSAGERFVGIVTLTESLAAKTSGAVSFEDVAAAQNAALLKVGNLNRPENVQKVRALNPDLILVIGWTRLLGPELLAIPPLGCIGFHASLLPRYRGRAPVNWAILNGEKETGNTMFFLDEGVDTGDIIAQRRIPIAYEDTCRTLYRKVADSAIDMLLENLPLLKEGRASRIRQDHGLATVMPARTPEQGVVDWSQSPRKLYDWVRALTHPYPGAFSSLHGRRLFIWQAMEPGDGPEAGRDAMPGEIAGVSGDALLVGAVGGLIGLTKVQWEGEPEMSGESLASFIGRRFEDGRSSA